MDVDEVLSGGSSLFIKVGQIYLTINTIVIFYNKKNHSALHMGKLYNNKSKKNMEPAENRKRPLTETTTHSEAAPVPGDSNPGAMPEQAE